MSVFVVQFVSLPHKLSNLGLIQGCLSLFLAVLCGINPLTNSEIIFSQSWFTGVDM